MIKQLGRRSFVGSIALLGTGFCFTERAAAAQAMGFDEARHLLSRTSFGIAPAEIQAIESMSYDTVIDQILAGGRHQLEVASPSWINTSPVEAGRMRSALAQEARTARAEGKKLPKIQPGQNQLGELEQWWVDEMLATDSPLVERMTLFWHNHFTTSVRKVRYAPALFRQNALFRREATGNFATLLRQISRDPAMLIYLDGVKSVARQPNENFGRELLELFTLGEGHYTEADVKAAARAFTGWTVDSETGSFVDHLDRHDTGEKTFLGKTGNLSGDDVLTILLAHPRTAETIVEKLWREFVSLKPDANEVSQLANNFRTSGYEIRPLLRSIFLSSAFRDPANRGSLLKSPLDLVIGTFRILGQPPSEKPELVHIFRNLGQVPFDPPSVKGWSGGKAWITSHTLLLRQQFLRRMIEATSVRSTAMDDNDGTTQLMQSQPLGQGRSPLTSRSDAKLPSVLGGVDSATLVRTLLPCQPLDIPIQGGSPDRVVATALLDIAYQLK